MTSRKVLIKTLIKRFWPLIILDAFIIAIPIILNYLLSLPAFTPIVGNNTDWLLFWGSYIGAIFSGGSAIIVLIIQYLQNRYENTKNRDLQIAVLKNQQYTQWLSELKTKILNYYDSFRYGDVKRLVELMCNQTISDLQKAEHLIQEAKMIKSSAEFSLYIILPKDKDEMEENIFSHLRRYNDEYNSLIDDLLWLTTVFINLSNKNFNSQETTKDIKKCVDNYKAQHTYPNIAQNRITSIIEMNDYDLCGRFQYIVELRLDSMQNIPLDKLQKILADIITYEQHKIDGIIANIVDS